MTATLTKLDDEPILIVTHEGFLTVENSFEVTARVVNVLTPVLVDEMYAASALPHRQPSTASATRTMEDRRVIRCAPPT